MKPEMVKVPREKWEHFNLAADCGIFVVLIPEPDPGHLKKLAGAEIVIKVYQKNQVMETRHILIKVEAYLTLELPSAPIKAKKGHK
jgi:hypothetical protein